MKLSYPPRVSFLSCQQLTPPSPYFLLLDPLRPFGPFHYTSHCSHTIFFFFLACVLVQISDRSIHGLKSYHIWWIGGYYHIVIHNADKRLMGSSFSNTDLSPFIGNDYVPLSFYQLELIIFLSKKYKKGDDSFRNIVLFCDFPQDWPLAA